MINDIQKLGLNVFFKLKTSLKLDKFSVDWVQGCQVWGGGTQGLDLKLNLVQFLFFYQYCPPEMSKLVLVNFYPIFMSSPFS